MAAYKDLVGQKITKVTSNPSEIKTGQMWYNSTDGKLRALGVLEATRSGTTMPNKKSLYGGGVGTSTAGLTVGGIDDSTYLNSCEEWNGVGWAAGGTYPTSRYSAGTAGTQTAAMAFCGRVPGSPGGPTETYEYNGSSWTSGNSFPTPGNSMQAIGAVDTAVVSTEVYTSTNMHHWNGTSWTSANARNTAKGGQAAFGTQTAAILAGGFPDNSNITELYDGTNWTSGNTMNTGRQQVAGSGTQTDGMAFGGDRPPSEAAQTTIESWDGTSWSTSPATLATARARAGAGRNTASGTWIGGGIGPGGGGEGFDATEIYEKSTNSITAAAWASGGALTVAVYDGAGAGTQTAGLAFGGDTAPDGTAAGSYEYDGTSWTAGNSLNNGRRELNGFGTQTAGVATLGGDTPATTYTEEYDGTNWSNANAASTARTMMGAAGIQTSGLVCGGNPGTMTTTEEYDGTNWSSGGALPVGKQSNDCFGNIVTAIRNVGGNTAPANYVSTTESYDGTNWTSGPTMLYGADRLAASGSSTSGLVCGGRESGTKTAKCANFDGTSYASSPNLSNSRSGQMATGKGETSNASSFLAGGYNPSNARMTATEEFTGEITTANIADFTTS
jgi:hypothetical protein